MSTGIRPLQDYANHLEAEKDITEYIVGFYNCVRLHSARGNLPPTVYERNMATKKPILVSQKFDRYRPLQTPLLIPYLVINFPQ